MVPARAGPADLEAGDVAAVRDDAFALRRRVLERFDCVCRFHERHLIAALAAAIRQNSSANQDSKAACACADRATLSEGWR